MRWLVALAGAVVDVRAAREGRVEGSGLQQVALVEDLDAKRLEEAVFSGLFDLHVAGGGRERKRRLDTTPRHGFLQRFKISCFTRSCSSLHRNERSTASGVIRGARRVASSWQRAA